MKRLALAALATAALTPLAWSQTKQAIPYSGEITHLKMDYATGEITTLDPAGETLVSSCYANNAFSGFFTQIGVVNDEFVDWGIKSCGLSGVACEIIFGYGTTALDPGLGGPGASMNIAFYPGYTGLCGALPPPAIVYGFTGLPGSPDGVSAAAFTITVDLTTAGFFAADGPLGWSYIAQDTVSGPLLITTTGTCGGPGDPATGTQDCFDIYSPMGGACLGTFVFGTAGIASFWMEIGEDDGSFGPGSQAQRFGTGGCNVGVLSTGSPPNVASTWDPSITTAAVGAATIDFIAISSLPVPGGVCSGGLEILIDLSAPLVTFAGGTGFGQPFAIPIPPNCRLIGANLSAQAGQVGFGFGLTNAIDITVGI